jgi:hypothetical protein
MSFPGPADSRPGSTDNFDTPPCSPASQRGQDIFHTPQPCESPLEFPAVASSSAVNTPVLVTPVVRPGASPGSLAFGSSAASAAPRQHLPLWRKLRPLYLQAQEEWQQGSDDGQNTSEGVAQPEGTREELSSADLSVEASELCAALKGRHGLEGRRLELSSTALEDEPGVLRFCHCLYSAQVHFSGACTVFRSPSEKGVGTQ